MQENNNTSSILKHHVDTAVNLINNLKKKNLQLETDNQILKADNKRIKEDMDRYINKINGHEKKLKALESLLADAQKEQTLLEQSIIAAISNLGTLDGSSDEISLKTPAVTPDTAYHENNNHLFEETESIIEDNVSDEVTFDTNNEEVPSIEAVIEQKTQDEDEEEQKKNYSEEQIEIF